MSIELQPLPAAAHRTNLYALDASPVQADSPSRPSSLSREPSLSSAGQLTLNPGSSLAPIDGGRQAWVFLACATIIEVMTWGLPFSVGILHEYWISHLFKDVPGAESTCTLAATLQTGLMYLTCAVFGPLGARYPRHRLHLQLFGLICATVGFIGSAFATSPTHILVCLGLVFPMCAAFYLPAATLLFEWFVERRGFASGVMYCGTGIGGTIFPFVMSALLNRFGYKAAMVSIGLGFGLMGAVTLCGIKERIPVPRSNATIAMRRQPLNFSFLRRTPFYAFLGAILTMSLGNFVPSVFVPVPYADRVGSKLTGTTLVSIMNAASVPGLLFIGWLSDHVHTRICILISAGGAAISCIFLWGFAGTSTGLLTTFVVLFGATGLAFAALWTKLITLIARDDTSLPGLLFSLFAAARGVGNVASGPMASALLKSSLFLGGPGGYGIAYGPSGAFGALFLVSGILQLVGTVVGLLYRDRKKA